MIDEMVCSLQCSRPCSGDGSVMWLFMFVRCHLVSDLDQIWLPACFAWTCVHIRVYMSVCITGTLTFRGSLVPMKKADYWSRDPARRCTRVAPVCRLVLMVCVLVRPSCASEMRTTVAPFVSSSDKRNSSEDWKCSGRGFAKVL